MTKETRGCSPNFGRLFGERRSAVTAAMKFKCFWVYFLSLAMILASIGCGYKPAYLQKSEKTRVGERWKVQKIDPSSLSAQEASVFERMGPPQFIRFYRKLDLDRDRVYMWIYTEPVRLVSFIDGKQVEYVVVDDKLSSLNEHQKDWLFWGGISAGAVVGAALLYYYLVGK